MYHSLPLLLSLCHSLSRNICIYFYYIYTELLLSQESGQRINQKVCSHLYRCGVGLCVYRCVCICIGVVCCIHILPYKSLVTSITAVSRSKNGSLLVTANDAGDIRLFRFPCVDEGVCPLSHIHSHTRTHLRTRSTHKTNIYISHDHLLHVKQ